MLEDFIEFVGSIFPSVSEDVKDAAKASIRQFRNDGKEQHLEFLRYKPLEQLSQGDVISDVPFVCFDTNGKMKMFKAKGMVLSTSCHIDQKKYVSMAPVLPLASFEEPEKLHELKNNTLYDYMHIHEGVLGDQYVDFEHICSYSKELIMHGLETERIKRLCSLNQIGFYLFVAKLAVFLLRTEDADTQVERG